MQHFFRRPLAPEARHEVHWLSGVVVDDRSGMLDCIVQDLSVKGARVAVGSGLPSDDIFNVGARATLFLDTETRASGRVAWRDSAVFGLEFDAPLPDDVVAEILRNPALR